MALVLAFYGRAHALAPGFRYKPSKLEPTNRRGRGIGTQLFESGLFSGAARVCSTRVRERGKPHPQNTDNNYSSSSKSSRSG